MKFSKLRLSGFKSFVDPTEIVIEEGLTGVVGPNGCGKSNVVEALRWVMGESSAKRMRGGEMDDVIFGGTTSRPARNIAEVALVIDNEDRRAPAALNDADELEVIRRIERTKGSYYKVNGREQRARDVQLLFADAGSGARSTGMVSQGRVGAIIAAKPSERRALLEEAANITGLHSRRHEAELRLKGAETNLERLDDVLKALAGQLHGLKQQAKQAARYRAVSEQIRRAESVLLHRRWEAAMADRGDAGKAMVTATDEVEAATSLASQAATKRADAAAGMPALREAEVTAAAELQRLTLARGELEAERRRVVEARTEAENRLGQIGGDIDREAALAEDARATAARLTDEAAALAQAREGEEEAQAKAKSELAEAHDTADGLEREISKATEAIATLEARRASYERQIRQLEDRARRLSETLTRLEEQKTALEADGTPVAEKMAAETDLAAAEAAVTEARGTAEAAASQLEVNRTAEEAALKAFREAESELASIDAERSALQRLLAVEAEDGDAPPILDALGVEAGWEVALAAALGEDLSAPIAGEAMSTETGGRRWQTLAPGGDAVAAPQGCEPLMPHVTGKGASALARRLSAVFVAADAETATRLQGALPVGARLVTREGGLWRWDGFVSDGQAGDPAAARLRQRNRLLELDGQRGPLVSMVEEARDAVGAAETARKEAVEGEQAARRAQAESLERVDRARKRLAAAEKKAADLAAKLAQLTESRERIDTEQAEIAEQKAEGTAALQELDDPDKLRSENTALRRSLAEKREILATARSDYDRLVREASARRDRAASLETETRTWNDRSERAAARIADLEGRKAEAAAEIERLSGRPAEIDKELGALSDRLAETEVRRKEAADALASAENVLGEADRLQREADAALAVAREARIRAEGRLEQVNQSLSQLRERISERLGCDPDQILENAGIPADEPLADAEAVEAKLERLTRERERIGPVNLRADQEVEELEQRIEGMENERDDLVAAIGRLRSAIAALNKEGRERLLESFDKVDGHFQDLFVRLFGGGRAHLTLIEGEDPLAAGLEIMASPPGKKLQHLSLLSGGEQALTAVALLFAVFLTNPAPICVLDEVDAPLDDTNVDRFCGLLDSIAEQTGTRFLIITHHRLTMARMDRLFGVTMAERGVSQLVSVDLEGAIRVRESA